MPPNTTETPRHCPNTSYVAVRHPKSALSLPLLLNRVLYLCGGTAKRPKQTKLKRNSTFASPSLALATTTNLLLTESSFPGGADRSACLPHRLRRHHPGAMVDEVASGSVPDVEDDPYQVYMLRRPAERSSSVVPQLPKQPEMADTRLRYRRIAPESRSGSFGSLGGHFPPRFEFPNRRSLLESLTSDDEASSFAVRRRRDPDKPKKKKKKRSARNPATSEDSLDTAAQKPPLPSAKVPPLTIAPPRPHGPDDRHTRDGSDSSTPLSTSPTTPVPGSPIDGRLTLPAHPSPTDSLGEAAALRLAENDIKPKPKQKKSASPPTPPEEHEPQVTPRKRRTLSPKQIIHPRGEEKVRGLDSAKVRRVHSHHKSAARIADSAVAKRADSHGTAARRMHSHGTPRHMHSSHASTAGGERPGGITVSNDGRPISAPAAMDPALREKFVLRPEEPVAYDSPSRPAEGGDWTRSKKKISRKKKRDGHGRPPHPPREETKPRRRDEAVLDDGEEMFARDKELSVSFAHRRYTFEEAAAKPLNAIQRLWHALAFARLSGGGWGRRR